MSLRAVKTYNFDVVLYIAVGCCVLPCVLSDKPPPSRTSSREDKETAGPSLVQYSICCERASDLRR